MKWDEVTLQKLRSELHLDIERLVTLRESNSKAADRVAVGTPDELDYAALGYTIHNCFNLIENYATRIAKLFENQVNPASWHRDLIERMQLDIRGVRPALLRCRRHYRIPYPLSSGPMTDLYAIWIS